MAKTSSEPYRQTSHQYKTERKTPHLPPKPVSLEEAYRSNLLLTRWATRLLQDFHEMRHHISKVVEELGNLAGIAKSGRITRKREYESSSDLHFLYVSRPSLPKRQSEIDASLKRIIKDSSQLMIKGWLPIVPFISIEPHVGAGSVGITQYNRRILWLDCQRLTPFFTLRAGEARKILWITSGFVTWAQTITLPPLQDHTPEDARALLVESSIIVRRSPYSLDPELSIVVYVELLHKLKGLQESEKILQLLRSNDGKSTSHKYPVSGETYLGLDCASRRLTIGTRTFPLVEGKVWEFLRELVYQDKIGRVTPRGEWKNAVDILRRKIGKDNLSKVIAFGGGGYRLSPNVRVTGTGQVGLRQTYQKKYPKL